MFSDWDGEISTIDSVFSSEKLAKSRVEEMSKVRPDLFWDIEEYIVDDLIKKE
jgi:hypothetical protein